MLRWYYHFAGETLIGAISALSSVRGESSSRFGKKVNDRLVDHLIIPEEDYKEKYGLNQVLIEGALATGE